MFYTSPDQNFSYDFQGAICFCEQDGKILALKRTPGCYEGGLWTAAPGGKLEKGETPLAGVLREVFEETSIRLDPEFVVWKGCYFFQFPDMEYGLHIFFSRLKELPRIVLNPKEHTESIWAFPSDVYKMPLMRGGKECLQTVFSLGNL